MSEQPLESSPVVRASGRARFGLKLITGSVSVVEGGRTVGTTMARQAEERVLVEPDWPASDLVFRTAFGKPLYPDTPSQLLPKLMGEHNAEHPSMTLPQIRLDDLRHIHATTLLLAGEPVHVMAARVGHTDPSVTLSVCAHVVQDPAPAAADTFARAVHAASRDDRRGCEHRR